MIWSFETRTYSECRPSIVLSVSRHVKHFKAVYSVKTQTKANFSRKHWLNYWHRCNYRCKGCLVHAIDALPLNFNHIAVYAYIVITCDGHKTRMCAKSDNTAMTIDLMVI